MRWNHLGLVTALLLVAPVVNAHEWDATWAGDPRPIVGDSLNYVDASPMPGRSGWLLKGRTMARLSPTGAVEVEVDDAFPIGNQVLRNLPDGGVLVRGAASEVARFDATGRLLWSVLAQSLTGTSLETVDKIVADDSGAVWYRDPTTENLHKIGPDGKLVLTRTAAELGLTTLGWLGVSPSGDTALVLGGIGTPEIRAASVRLSRDGTVLSSWSANAGTTGPYAVISGVVANDTQALTIAAGRDGRVTVVRHDAAGVTLLPTQAFYGSFGYVKPTPTGFVFMNSANVPPFGPSRQTAQFFSASGEFISQHDLPDNDFIDESRLETDAEGRLWGVTHNMDIFGTQSWWLTRMTPSEVRRIRLPETVGHNAFIATTPENDSAIIADDSRRYRFSLAGQSTELPALSPVMGPMRRVMAATTPTGDSYVIQRPNYVVGAPGWNTGTSEGATISRIARDGSVRWAVAMPSGMRFAALFSPYEFNHIVANAERLCYFTANGYIVYCHSAANGALLTRTSVPTNTYSALALDASNRLMLYGPLAGATPLLAYDANFLQIAAAQFDAAMLAPNLYHAGGYEWYFDGNDGTAITSIRREARVTHASTPALTWQLGESLRPARLPDGQPAVLALADGSALLLAFGNSAQSPPLQLRKLNADGTLGFRHAFDFVAHQAHFRIAGDQVLVSTHTDVVYPNDGKAQLFGIALADGALRWQHRIHLPGPYYEQARAAGEVLVDADGAHAQWWTGDTVDFNVHNIRLADGVITGRVDLPCNYYPCVPYRVLADAQGVTVMPEVSRREHALFPAAIRADQETLEGAWYQSKTSGQGMLFDYLPAQRVWFGTWHTNDIGDEDALSDDYDPSRMRWFTLQGTVSADNTRVDLGIYRATGGWFDSAPTIASERIGDAILSFDTCGSANLQYRFTGGEWQDDSGAIPLRALVPQNACAALGAAVVPPTSVSDRGGIGRRHSGTWYEPATSGQGIEASIHPELGNGLVFAGWFTFDPQGAPDDATTQHWFTLQGDLAAAANGSVTLSIYRTTGGAFDRSGTRNTWRVGEATWQFSDCNQSTLQYRFDDNDLAGAFSERTGTLELQRLGACPSP